MKKTKKKSRSTSDPNRTTAIIDFLSLGFKDYLAARVLLNSGLPLQGAVLASTAIEKHVKALLAIRGETSTGHLQKAHFNSLKNFLPHVYAKLSPSFLEFLQKVYILRYTDQLNPGFNLNVYAVMTLAELDFTIAEIRSSFRLHRDGSPVKTNYEAALESSDERLIKNNHILQGIPKSEFLKQPDKVYAVRMRPVEGILEAEFTTYESRSDGNFLTVALRPVTPEELAQQSEKKHV